MQGIPASSNSQPQPAVFYIAPTTEASTKYNVNSKTFMALGITQIVVGVLCWGFQIGAAVSQASIWFVMGGIWAGIFFIIAGTFGVVAANRQTRCPIITCMVMSILSAVFTVSILTSASIGLTNDQRCYYYTYPYDKCQYTYNKDAKLAMNTILVLLSVVEAGVAIASAAMCCGAICCGSKISPQYTQPVSFNNGLGNQQVILLPPGQHLPQQAVPSQQAFPQQPFAGNMLVVQSAGNAQTTIPMYRSPPPGYNVSIPSVNQQGASSLNVDNWTYQAMAPPIGQGGGLSVVSSNEKAKE